MIYKSPSMCISYIPFSKAIESMQDLLIYFWRGASGIVLMAVVSLASTLQCLTSDPITH